MNPSSSNSDSTMPPPTNPSTSGEGNRGSQEGDGSSGEQQQQRQQQIQHLLLQPAAILPHPHRRQQLTPQDVLLQTVAQAAGRYARARFAPSVIGDAQVRADVDFITTMPLSVAEYASLGWFGGGTGQRVDRLTVLLAAYQRLAVGLAALQGAIVTDTISPDVAHYLLMAGLASRGPVNLAMAAAWSAVAYADPTSPLMIDGAGLRGSFLQATADTWGVGMQPSAVLLAATSWLSQAIESLVELFRLSQQEFPQQEGLPQDARQHQ